MASSLERVRQLIALTASDSENEARNAAYQACKLIREHGFEVGEKSSPAFRAPPPDYDIGSIMRETFEREMRRREQEAMADILRNFGNEAGKAGPKKQRGAEPKAKVQGTIMRKNHLGVGKRCQHCGERTVHPAFVSIDADFYHPECVDRI